MSTTVGVTSITVDRTVRRVVVRVTVQHVFQRQAATVTDIQSCDLFKGKFDDTAIIKIVTQIFSEL